MSWIKEEINRRKRQKDLSKNADELCMAVWHEIRQRAHEAADEGLPVIADGDQIILKGNQPKTLTVEVGGDGRSVEGSNGIRLPLGWSGDSPSLMQPNGSSAISVEEAARQILKPFLFGD